VATILRFNDVEEPIPADAGEPPNGAAAYLYPSTDGQVPGRWVMTYAESFRLRSKGHKVLFLVEATE
jgi:hypothetical protein